ncbi:dTMP kinase [Thermaurantiacus sp.]
MLIAFEGGEGAGKSTQASLLAERLQRDGHAVEVSREPGGTPGAEAIRDLLVSGARDRWTAETEALLVAAARADHVTRRIRPALEAGRIVLLDRFIHSTLAYQGYGRGVQLADLRLLHRVATGDLWPDLVVLLDLPADAGLARAGRRGGANRFDRLDPAFHARVREGYLALAADDPRIRRVDGLAPPDAVAEAVWREVHVYLPPRDRRA